MEECAVSRGAAGARRADRRALRPPQRSASAIAFVLQAVIFGGAHANYPGFPPYSRLVELVVPSMLWAAIFLRFGLLPTILLHALFDLALFSIPLFLVDAPGAWAAARRRDRRGARAARRRAVAPGAGRRVGRAAGVAAQRRVAAAARRRRRRRAAARVVAAVARAGSRPARAARARPRGPRRVGRVHADAAPTCRRCRSTAPRAEAAADAALKARGVDARPRMAALLDGAARERRAAVDAAQVRLARGGRRRLPRARRHDARAAAVGRALRDVRRRRRRARRGVARHDRAATAAVRQVRHVLPEARPGARLAEGRRAGARASGICASASASIPPR